MKEKIYKLDDYKIVESDTGQLVWEAHFGFGEIQKGRCYKIGSILFLCSTKNYQVGFLKGEFIDDLRKYPKWGKTEFYCIGVDIRHCKNGKSVTKDEMMLWAHIHQSKEQIKIHRITDKILSDSTSDGRVIENSAYRLYGYEIMVENDGQIISKKFSGSNSVTKGKCFILENILFIGPQKSKPSKSTKTQFYSNLRQLPVWDQTEYFAKKYFLHKCMLGNEIKKKRKNLQHKVDTNQKKYEGNEYKYNRVSKSLKTVYHTSFIAESSTNLGLPSEFNKSQKEHNQSSRLKLIISYFSCKIRVLIDYCITILKKIFSSVEFIFHLSTSFFAIIFSLLKKQHKKVNDKKKKGVSFYSI
ncbi:MAG: hypothetical protein V2J65_08845 [Desulfobacteraceae bacterium]|jgi:hypothetical protein|nr:hypothetical protein [Desulfobacteraceae bacterium]